MGYKVTHTSQSCPDPEVISKIWDKKIKIKHAFLILGETVVKKRTVDLKQDLNQQPAKAAAAQLESPIEKLKHWDQDK